VSQSPFDAVDQLCVDTLRFLAVDMIDAADSGHPGLPLGAAPMAYALWNRHLRYNPAEPDWADRDRFVLSAGHGSSLLYALLHLSGYDLPLDELRRFRQWSSRAPGHPERGETPGVEVTTGPLGQGVANAVGLAIAERHLAERFNRNGASPLVDHYTYALVGDGDLMEGVALEAISLAGHLKLGRLICLYDSNGISLAAETRLAFTEDVGARCAACGWQVLQVADGNDLAAIDAAIGAAKADDERPTLIVVATHIGYGSSKQDSCDAHGSPLGKAESAATKQRLNWPGTTPFFIPAEVTERFREASNRATAHAQGWTQRLNDLAASAPELAAEWLLGQRGELPAGWEKDLPAYPAGSKAIATRAAGGEIMNALAKRIRNLIGGSADLDPSTKTALKGKGSFQAPQRSSEKVQGADAGGWSYAGANIAYGVREHAMAAISNGIAAHGGLLPFCATFFVFSDYLRPALRISALSRLPVIYVFTHDSIAVGEDGPTHQPVEHLASLRIIPGVVTLRPADANETLQAWKIALERHSGPTCLILSRQNLPVLAANAEVERGGYILLDAPGGVPELIVIATGAEIHAALAACRNLHQDGVAARLVSLPSWELFEAQPQSYRDAVLPPGVRQRLSVEAGSTFGWSRYVGDAGVSIGIDRFGASAPGDENLARFGFGAESIAAAARKLLVQ
jgi:transketolase